MKSACGYPRYSSSPNEPRNEPRYSTSHHKAAKDHPRAPNMAGRSVPHQNSDDKFPMEVGSK